MIKRKTGWYNPKKAGMQRTPYSVSIFDTDSIHLLTRHSNKMSTRGYLAPLTITSWFYFGIAAWLIQVVISKDLSPEGKKHIKFSLSVLILAFSVIYNQDLRSSAIEPWYENLPQTLSEVNMRSQSLVSFGRIPSIAHIFYWNKFVLKSYEMDMKQADICLDYGCQMIVHAMKRMAKDPNYFMLLSKDSYYTDVLRFNGYNRFNSLGSLNDGRWEWKFSPKVSSYINSGVVYRKYQKWAETLNLLILKQMVCELLNFPFRCITC